MMGDNSLRETVAAALWGATWRLRTWEEAKEAPDIANAVKGCLEHAEAVVKALATSPAPATGTSGEEEAEVRRILAMSDEEVLAEANVGDVAWARGFKQGLATGNRIALTASPSIAEGPSIPVGMRQVPQAWIDRAMQIEAASDVLYAHARDAIAQARRTTAHRLYSANIVQVESAMEGVALALNTPEPVFPLTTPRATPPEEQPVQGEVELPDSLAGHWDTPGGREMAETALHETRAMLTKGDMTDFALANRQFLASRDDIDLIVWQTAAKERIRWLSAQLARAALSTPSATDQGEASQRRGEQRAIARIVNVARAIGWQAGVGGRETAGAIVSYLATSPDEIAPFVNGDLMPLDFKGDWMRGGCLSWHAKDGRVVYPEDIAPSATVETDNPASQNGGQDNG